MPCEQGAFLPYRHISPWNTASGTRRFRLSASFSLQQHTGSRLRSLVAPGDSVREGMVIAESGSRLAVPLHAPIPGRVATLGTTTLLDGTTSEALSIELDGEFDRLGKSPEPREWRDLSPENLLSVIRTAGVVCGPRSSVPAHTYLQRSRRAKPPVVVLDVAETEPYLSADAEIAAAAAESVVGAMEILAHVLGTERLHAVVARGYTRVRRALRAASAEKTITFHTVPSGIPPIRSTTCAVPSACVPERTPRLTLSPSHRRLSSRFSTPSSFTSRRLTG
jgi:electron transport complex protein RnfC